MTDVLYVPKLTNNLFSVHAATTNLKGTQCHLSTRAAAFTIKTGRLLLLDLPWGSYTGLIVKYNSHLLRRLQSLKLV